MPWILNCNMLNFIREYSSKVIVKRNFQISFTHIFLKGLETSFWSDAKRANIDSLTNLTKSLFATD